MAFLTGRRVVVTGGAGFLGREVCRQLQAYQPAEVFVPRRATFDLRHQRAIERLMQTARPEIVIHLAAVVGGIGVNRDNPGRFCYENAIMGLELMEQSRIHGVEKYVLAGTICSYPKHVPIPFREKDIWNGYPEETNAPYGLAKKLLMVQAQAYHQQYGMNAISLLPVNLYGPGDNFDRHSSHVIPALIRKVMEAQSQGLDHIDVWGTGRVSREFLFVRDAAEAVVLAAERYNDPDPVNVGSGREITIGALAELICEICHYRGEIRFDPSQPDGQPRRCLDTTRARDRFGFEAQTDFREGLRETIEWYRHHGATREPSEAA